MREEMLTIIEKNSRIDVKELAVILGVEEIDVINELQKCEEEGIICGYHTLINWDKMDVEKVSALIEVRVTRSVDRALIILRKESINIRRYMRFI